MKKYILVLILGVSSLISACKKNGGSVTPPVNSVSATLIGKWNWVKSGSINPIGGNEVLSDPAAGSFRQFNADGSASYGITGVQNLLSSWELIDDTHVKFGEASAIRVITKLDDHNLNYYYDYDSNGQTNRNTYYYTR
jgi:hypothetical protein